MKLGKISCDSVNRIEIPPLLDDLANSVKNEPIVGFFDKWEIQNARGWK